jgi:hypothetical protein
MTTPSCDAGLGTPSWHASLVVRPPLGGAVTASSGFVSDSLGLSATKV